VDREPTAFHRTVFLFVSPHVSLYRAALFRCAALTPPGRATSSSGLAPCAPFAVSCLEQTGFTPSSLQVRREAAELLAWALSARVVLQRTARLSQTLQPLPLSPGARSGESRGSNQAAAYDALLGRWADAAPFPEWELVTDEEPCVGEGAAAETLSAEPATNPPAVSVAAAGHGAGGEEQVRALFRLLRAAER